MLLVSCIVKYTFALDNKSLLLIYWSIQDASDIVSLKSGSLLF